MGADSALKHRVAVNTEVMGCDGRRKIWATGFNERHGVGRRDVFENHLERGKIRDQLRKDAVDEDSLTVKDVDMAIRHLTMDQQRHADPLHDLKHAVDLSDVRDAVIRVGGGVRGVELAGREYAICKAAFDFASVDGVGEVAGHQRLEGQARLNSSEDAVSIALRGRDSRDWRIEIGHDNGPRNLPGRVVDDGGEHGAVAKVDMPIIGPPERQPLCSLRRFGREGVDVSYRHRLNSPPPSPDAPC